MLAVGGDQRVCQECESMRLPCCCSVPCDPLRRHHNSLCVRGSREEVVSAEELESETEGFERDTEDHPQYKLIFIISPNITRRPTYPP